MPTTSTSQINIVLKAVDDTKGAIDSVVGNLNRMRDSVAGIARYAVGDILGNLGSEAIESAVSAVKDFAGGMISANSQIDLMKQRLDILYQSASEGAQAFAFLQQNELTKPFDISDIMAASTQLVAFKQNIVTMLPAIEDVAGAMGQNLPTAAQAFTDALEGRFSMLRRDLGISKEQLVQFGLQMDKTGHITNPESFTSAFLALANSSEFQGGANKLAQTWTGLMSSMRSQWLYFQANVGSGAFNTLKAQLRDLVSYLQNNKAAVAQFESTVGSALGSMTTGFVAFAKFLVADLPPAINFVRNAFADIEPPVAAAFTAISATIGGFVTWFRGNVLPDIAILIGTVSQWWAAHANDISRDFTFIVSTASEFAGTIVSVVQGAWNAISDLTKFLWDGLKLSFTLGFDLLTGNFGAFKDDFISGVQGLTSDAIRTFGDIVTGFVDITTNLGIDLVTAMVPIANKLMGPWTWFAQTFRSLFKDLGTFIGGFAQQILSVMSDLMTNVDKVMNGVVDTWNAVADKSFGKITKMDRVDMADPIKGAGQGINKDITSWFNTHAPGLNQGQNYTGISVSQAQKDLQANAKRLTDPFNSFINGIVNDMISVVDPQGKNGGTTKVSAQTAGQNLVSSIWDGLFGSGGALSGLTKSPSGAPAHVTAATVAKSAGFDLPVPGSFPSASPSASTAKSTGTSLSPTGRVPLGNLGATFMQTLATGGRLGSGENPATKAAQQQVTQQQRQISQGDTQTKLMQDTNALLKDAAQALHDMRGFLAHLTGPQAAQGNPLQSRGVARPVGI